MHIQRPCLHHGCPNLTQHGYCDEHAHIRAEQGRQSDKEYNKHRPEHHAFYKTGAWERVRARHLASNPLCVDCSTPERPMAATEVHHKVKVKDDKGKRLDRKNLMSLCESCHAKRTARGE